MQASDTPKAIRSLIVKYGDMRVDEINEMCPVCGGTGTQFSEGMARDINHPGIECGTCKGTCIRP